ncbi:hypothetical protein H257_14276 [Aphanomyces astaci]|uniref:H(+)-exporting diphosphatase n=1 Tax=Aphanomyces astaci TaxID=112090 RepID=W4FTZ7_APHAT|nr:hypothetical protein H257_14276 [Aphanomyces astaci]ETV70118.1 hypothetical protein H257_14276 [Aphanomyces astaci]|eukprot:XP_009840349.1 hypothetical protein H257_14276 [Aphanomyces astaci]
MLLHAALTPVMSATEIPMLMVGFVSSVVALCNWAGHLHQGADLVGKVEQGIPKDDSRNPSVIADLVGTWSSSASGWMVVVCVGMQR